MIVFLDMDGVLADFEGAIADKFDIPSESVKDFMDQNSRKIYTDLRGTDWFYNLKPFPAAETLVNYVDKATKGSWGILSSPLRNDRDNSAYWKRRWLEDNGFLPKDINKLIFEGNKEKYARNDLTDSPNILVDDKLSKVNRFENKGGIGIHYEANRNMVTWAMTKIQKALDS